MLVLYISFAIAAGEPGLLLLVWGLKPAEYFRIEIPAPPEKTRAIKSTKVIEVAREVATSRAPMLPKCTYVVKLPF